MENLDWLPDWRNEAAYPNREKTSIRKWAWEFLRRNESYQNDFERFSQLDGIIEADTYYITENDKKPTLTSEQRAYLQSRSNFGIGTFIDPAYNADDNNELRFLTQLWSFQPYLMYADDPDFPFVPLTAQGEVIIRFDLRYSKIGTQIKEAEEILERLHCKLAKNGILDNTQKISDVDKFLLFLRLLDGNKASASRSEMAQLLFPQDFELDPSNAQSRIDADLKMAKQIRDGKYRSLIRIHGNKDLV